MSRVGKLPVKIEDKVDVSVANNVVTVKGGKNTLTVPFRPEVNVEVKDGHVHVTRIDDSKVARSMHGLYRTLIANAIEGVSKGYSKTLELNGVGYRAAVKGKQIEMNLGYSHPVIYDLPEGIEAKVDKQTTLTVSGADKALVGQVAAKVRSFRPPEPYLGKGVKYSDEVIRRKAGKSAGK